MPSFFKRSKAKEKEAEEEKANAERPATPPPTYEATQEEPPPFEDRPPPFEASGAGRRGGGGGGGGGGKAPYTEADVANITAAFASLRLGTQSDPDVDSCLAHLKLLYAIQTLKEEVGYTDGLWDLWDVRAGPPDSPHKGDVKEKGGPGGDAGPSKEPEDRRKKVLAIVREKRWALYLARAVDRYETWWKTLSEGRRLREAEMGDPQNPSRYATFPEGSEDYPWSVDVLPPLDVLMVWHTHMLNPRAFLEDSIRWGLRTLWTTGMPWAQVNQAIDSKFNYEASDLARSNWERTTGRSWDNIEEPMVKSLQCPSCKRAMEVPWTTCGLPETYKGDSRPGLVGNGYGDGEFSQRCDPGCGTLVTQRLLSVAKMIGDAEAYLNEGITIPSTVLDPKTGMPVVGDAEKLLEVTFPNRLVGHGIASQLFDMLQPGLHENCSMKHVRDLVTVALQSDAAFSRIQEAKIAQIGRKEGMASRQMERTERFQTSKMMSRYWENHSIFALDLVAAVMRQGVFVGKMYSLDWLHGPNARGTMDRLVQKYNRFMLILTENAFMMCVPTLDVDLAWHTHQLAPRAYYKFSTYNSATKGSKEARFIDHDDKVDEDQLSSSFEWTGKLYLDKFGEVYSECICWYCEVNRIQATANSTAVFGRTKGQKAVDNFNNSPAANSPACHPSSSAHISAHNSCLSSSPLHRGREFQRAIWKSRLDDGYERAVKRTAKRGRKLPPKEEFYDHWGKTYHQYAPNLFPGYLTSDLYVAGDPGILHGNWASCAQGLCGTNDIAAGGCGGPGGCTNSSGYWTGSGRGKPVCAGVVAGAGMVGGGCGGGGGGGCGGGGGS
ncbi:Glycine-rich domain-containing protein 2 [Colletotrichum higginsianum]|uniref:Glycine-rich domain-containing protein 2 n=1 Tax=Colletotrichum higginsianum TaxID=80884 RepID=A0A4T0WLG0_9PEZI|nr:Glycine-rich domain-containing protein 2 [Colletotrichum higginsianum]